MHEMNELRPAVEFATGQQSIKGEDFILVQPIVSFPKAVKVPSYSSHGVHLSDSASSQHGILGEATEDDIWGTPSLKSRRSSEKLLASGPASFGLYCVMDGHNGKTAAQHLQNTLKATLEERMPSGNPPSEQNKAAFSSWCDDIQKAVIQTFASVNEEFACRGELAGTTATILVQYGWHLTVANLGDSKALLDIGSQHCDLSEDHRISTHQGDRRRLEAMNAHIAPICGSGSGPASKDGVGHGPLRVWPGGSCLSRGVGDFDIGPPVIACPFISQVRIPNTGGRVILASDGVWDGFENVKKMLKISRIYNCQSAPEKIIHCLKNAFGGLRDDTSLIVLDIMPPGSAFTDLAQQQKKNNSMTPRRSSSNGCLCFSGNAEMVKEEPTKPLKPIQPPEFLIQIDVAEAVGLMSKNTIKIKPSWCTEDFCETIRCSQEAACNAWLEARSIRSTGRTPSRMDLESFFSAVHHVKPLKESDAKSENTSVHKNVSERFNTFEDQRNLDITTRPPSLTHEDSAHARSHTPKLLNSTERLSFDSRDNASQHFKDHVGQPASYPQKFGLYKAHMLQQGDEGSTTEDDSQRNGSYMSSPFGTPKRVSFSDDNQSPPNPTTLEDEANDSSSRRRRSHSSFDLSLNGSMSALPTVEEEVTTAKSHKLQDIVAECHNFTPQAGSKEATEMAVRRGKNRFTPNGPLSAPTENNFNANPELKSPKGRPPLPSPQKA